MSRLVLLGLLFASLLAVTLAQDWDEEEDVDHKDDLFWCKFTRNITIDGHTTIEYDDCKMTQGYDDFHPDLSWWPIPALNGNQTINLGTFQMNFEGTDLFTWVPTPKPHDWYMVHKWDGDNADDNTIWSPPIKRDHLIPSNATIVMFKYALGQLGVGLFSVTIVPMTGAHASSCVQDNYDKFEMFSTKDNHGRGWSRQKLIVQMSEVQQILQRVCTNETTFELFQIRFAFYDGKLWSAQRNFSQAFPTFGSAGVALDSIRLVNASAANIKRYLVDPSRPPGNLTTEHLTTFCFFPSNGNFSWDKWNCQPGHVLIIPDDPTTLHWKIGPAQPPSLGHRVNENDGVDIGDADYYLTGRYLVASSSDIPAGTPNDTRVPTHAIIAYEPLRDGPPKGITQRFFFAYQSYGDTRCCANLEAFVVKKSNGVRYPLLSVPFVGQYANAWMNYSVTLRGIEVDDRFVIVGTLCRNSGHVAVDDIGIEEISDPNVPVDHFLDVTPRGRVNTSPICVSDNVGAAPPNRIPCHDFKHCVDYKQLCDGTQDCMDNSDEKYCSLYQDCGAFTRHNNPGQIWPWLVSIQARTLLNQYIHVCGGTLVHPKWVLTSASCLKLLQSMPSRDLHVRTGQRNLLDYPERGVDNIPVYDMILPKQFQFDKAGGDFDFDIDFPDIGLIVLERWALITEKVRPLCLPRAGQKYYAKVNTTVCQLGGWSHRHPTPSEKSALAAAIGEQSVHWGPNPSPAGQGYCPRLTPFNELLIIVESYFKSFDISPLILPPPVSVPHTVGMGIIPLKQCAAAYHFHLNKTGRLGFDDLCGVDIAQTPPDFCQRDSGSPLMCQRDQANPNSEWVAHGVVSAGSICTQPDLPTIFGRVGFAVDWVIDKMASYNPNN